MSPKGILFSLIPCLQSTPGCRHTPVSTAGASGPEEGRRPSPESALSAGSTVGASAPDGPLGKRNKTTESQRLWIRGRLRDLIEMSPSTHLCINCSTNILKGR